MMKVKFKEWDCNVVLAKYGNGRIAIQLLEVDTHQPIATATLNVPSSACPIEEDEVIVKDYAENQGMLNCLVDAGVVSPPHRVVPLPYAGGHLCGLLMKENNDG